MRRQVGAAPILNDDGVTKAYVDAFIPASLADAAGDIFVGYGNNLVTRLPVGANGLMLIADSGETVGMKWAPGSRVVGVNAQTGTTYTPVLSDEGKIVTLSNTGAITVTMPQDSSVAIPIGGSIIFYVRNTGMATFVPGTGVNPIEATPSAVSRAQYSWVEAIKIAADTWALTGDLA